MAELNNQNSEKRNIDAGMASMFKTLHVLFIFLRIFIVIVLVYSIFFSGLFQIGTQEEAFHFRFGKMVKHNGSATLKSGKLYWGFPYPIDTVKKIVAKKSITIETTQFWPQVKVAADKSKKEFFVNEKELEPGKDGYLLTGDANILHLKCSINYSIKNSKDYFLNFYEAKGKDDKKRGIEALIENILNEAILQVAAEHSIDKLYASQSKLEVVSSNTNIVLSTIIKNKFLKILDNNSGLKDLGLDPQISISVKREVPKATAEAFASVTQAATESEKLVTDGITYRNSKISQAKSEATRLLNDAEAYRKQVVSAIEAQRGSFLAMRSQLDNNDKNQSIKATLVGIYYNKMANILRKVGTKFIIHEKNKGKLEARIQINKRPKKKQR